ncbi:CRISPR-associated endonuclease Cas2 [Campylobacter porcelli]|uniref:CRISPR-associated endoribonuclease Cas2 n=1 Tax=Campylobacter porcelli TaxID=1660073 RepID=A0A1X9SVD4_9BACT|nr:CRISPR-associated endonuclease Cas2 [Campylobacter sp. RM6137]ARR00217.1 CRISPR/Cas system-associated endoribonuclease Cas2, type II-B/NMENI [Campylobacter sp. RM6137]
MRYLICYDIEDNKNRTKLFERLKDFNLLPVQKSVFYGELSKADKIAIKALLHRHCSKSDKAIITSVNLDIDDTLGYSKEYFKSKSYEII